MNKRRWRFDITPRKLVWRCQRNVVNDCWLTRTRIPPKMSSMMVIMVIFHWNIVTRKQNDVYDISVIVGVAWLACLHKPSLHASSWQSEWTCEPYCVRHLLILVSKEVKNLRRKFTLVRRDPTGGMTTMICVNLDITTQNQSVQCASAYSVQIKIVGPIAIIVGNPLKFLNRNSATFYWRLTLIDDRENSEAIQTQSYVRRNLKTVSFTDVFLPTLRR